MARYKAAHLFIVLLAGFIMSKGAYCLEGDGMAGQGQFEKISNEASVKDGVKEITYEQFVRIRNSGEEYLLLDVLSLDSYESGHIGGAISFPEGSIDNDSANIMIPKGSRIIVYCGNFKCGASTSAAKKLSGMGYDVLDYKGGLKDWQDKGNELSK